MTAVSCGPVAEPQSVVLIVTADGDGYLEGVPLAVGGGRPVGGVDRLTQALDTELGYFPDAVIVSAGGDIGDFPESSRHQTAEVLSGLGYAAVTMGASEADSCDDWPDEAPALISANVTHPIVVETHIQTGDPPIGITAVSGAQQSSNCLTATQTDPLEALMALFASEPSVEYWIVLSQLGVEGVYLAQQLADASAPVLAVVTAGARREASSLPYEPPALNRLVVLDGGREWRDVLVLRLEFDDDGLVSCHGTRRIVLDDVQ